MTLHPTFGADDVRCTSTAQVVEIDGDVLEKPDNASHAADMLSRCSLDSS